jgi:hypothetical protein
MSDLKSKVEDLIATYKQVIKGVASGDTEIYQGVELVEGVIEDLEELIS